MSDLNLRAFKSRAGGTKTFLVDKNDESIKNPEEGPMPKRSTDFVDNFFYHFVDKFNVFKRAEKLVEKRAGNKKLFEKL